MKIIRRTNHKGVELKEWHLIREDDLYYYLKEPDKKLEVRMERDSVDEQISEDGASKKGDVFLLPSIGPSKG